MANETGPDFCRLTDRFSGIPSSPDFQKVFLGILESASIRSVKSGMLREIGGRNRRETGPPIGSQSWT
jgi:hypothetical protein